MASALALATLIPRVWAAEPTVNPSEIPLKDVLVIRSVARPGRAAVHVDPIEGRLVAGKWLAPHVGDTVSTDSGSERSWEAATASEPPRMATSPGFCGLLPRFQLPVAFQLPPLPDQLSITPDFDWPEIPRTC